MEILGEDQVCQRPGLMVNVSVREVHRRRRSWAPFASGWCSRMLNPDVCLDVGP